MRSAAVGWTQGTKRAAVSLVAAAALLGEGSACTTFVLEAEDGPLFGRNYDWATGVGRLTVNPRGSRRTALVAEGRVPVRWTARYGSVTFDQYGRDFATGGMNEMGLVVEVMWLEGTVYSERDPRPELDELQWVQYQLDTARTVQEVLDSDRHVRISRESVPLHFLVADRSGRAAAIEFLDGRMVAHAGEALPIKALANSRYDESVAFVRQGGRGMGEPDAPAFRRGSLGRFATVARGIAAARPRGADAVAAAFDLLSRAAQAGSTRWSIVYDLRDLRAHFRTPDRPSTRFVDVGRLDYACGGAALSLDLEGEGAGDVAGKLAPCDARCNRAAIAAAFAATGWTISPEDLERRARHPETAACEGPTSPESRRSAGPGSPGRP